MRGLGFRDCAPVSDAGLTLALQRWFHLETRPGASETLCLMASFAPHRSLATFHLWATLQRIPFGETRSYGHLAADLGDPTLSRALSRAVGRANGANPVSILVPCHRVIGADGTLTGYAGGLARKEPLLRLEGALRP